MAALEEIAEFVEEILRLDLDTPIRGFDGKELGESNQQAQALANRTQWLKEKFEALGKKLENITETKFVASINEKTGEVILTYEDLGAAAKEHNHLPSDIETDDNSQFVSAEEKDTWNNKQPLLVSGETLKTILGISLLGNGNITFTTKDIRADDDFLYSTQLEKDKWDGKQEQLVSGENINTLHGKSLLGNGNVLLTYKDVGADESGAGTAAVNDHVAQTDPHEQYMTVERGKKIFINKNLGNKPTGFLQLDDRGKIPADIADLYKAEYVIVANAEGRLKIAQTSGIIICLQLDENAMYYLNADEDPSVSDNWKKGQETTIGNVLSTFGRSGNVVAEAGDYNADQITETDDRTFVSSEDREKWNKSQGELVSGVNIKTILGQSLLGAGDIIFKSKDIETDDNNLFVTAVEKKAWNGKQAKLVSGSNIGTIHGKSLLDGRNIRLDYEDVGAEKEGTANNTLNRHIAATDPHTQYLTKTRGDGYYLNKNLGNRPNGFLQLDSQGNIPAVIADLFTARYIIANDKKERLAIKEGGDITICLQLDENITYYLNAGANPAVESNWREGQKTEVNQITSVFGRVGGIVAKEGDYNANQITETEEKTFVSADDREKWDEKQDQLKSGENIATVLGKNLLEGGDIGLENNAEFTRALYQTIAPGEGLTAEIDEERNQLKLNLTMGGFTEQDVENAEANKHYYYPLEPGETSLNNIAVVYKEEEIFEGGERTIDYDNPEFPVERTEVSDLVGENIDGELTAISDQIERYTSPEITLDSLPEDTEGLDFNLLVEDNSINVVPPFTSDTGSQGYVPISSTSYSGLPAWKAFQTELTGSSINRVPNLDYWSDNQIWRNRKNEVFIGIKNDDSFPIVSYSIQQFGSLYWGSNSAIPTAWKFQGRYSDTAEWVTLDTQEDQQLVDSSGEWLDYYLEERASYRQYRLLITDVNQDVGGRASLARIKFTDETGFVLKSKDGKYISINEDGSIEVENITTVPQFADKTIKYTTEPVKVSLLKEHFPIKMVSLIEAETTITPHKGEDCMGFQTIPVGYEGMLRWRRLDFSNAYDEVSKEEIRAAFSPNGKEFYIFNHETRDWDSMGELTLDVDSAGKLLENGMEWLEVYAAAYDWDKFFEIEETEEVTFAFARRVLNVNEIITPQIVTLSYDSEYGWELQSLDSVKVAIMPKKIVFTPSKEGKYKFCYTFK